jgi:hypothetical protein
MKTSNTARTGMEQLLISNAVDQSLDKINFAPFANQVVYVEEKYLDCVDKNYVAGSIRHRLLRVNATLASKPEEATVVMEIRSGGVGTDTAESFFGTPAITLPGMMTIPEVKLVTHQNQTAVAKIGIVAVDGKTKESLGSGGLTMAKSDDSNWFVLGVGPYQNGTVRHEVTRGLQNHQGTVNQPLPQMVAFQAPMSGGLEAEPGKTKLANMQKQLPDTPSPDSSTPDVPPQTGKSLGEPAWFENVH